MDYLKSNADYWESGYTAPMVDHHVFRLYGRILKPYFNLPKKYTSLLDFGCGQGAAVNYYAGLKFDSYGVDISKFDIDVARHRFPGIANSFSTCEPKPLNNKHYGNLEKYDVITAFQSLYYFTKKDFEDLMEKLYNQLNKGGIFFATMMGTKSEEYFKNSKETDDAWLRCVNFTNSRYQCKDYYIFFTENQNELCNRFSMFKPMHLGWYSGKFTSEEGDGFHYTFCGVKE